MRFFAMILGLPASEADGLLASSSANVVYVGIAGAVAVAALFLAISDFFAYVKQIHKTKLLKAKLSRATECRLEEHLEECPFEIREGETARPSLSQVIRLVRACENTLAWTAILPALCYMVGCLLLMAEDLIKDSIGTDAKGAIGVNALYSGVFLAGFLLQLVHHAFAYHLKLHEVLYSLKLSETPYGPVEGYVRAKIGAHS